jgi:homoserine/homoserine lactone efflux protein
MTWAHYLTYLSIVAIATVTPGPSMLLALSHGACHGMRPALRSGLGNMFGNLLQALVSVAGLQSILMASHLVFQTIQWAGVGYLVYLGIRLWCQPVSDEQRTDNRGDTRRRSSKRLFADGFMVAVANPKGLVFFTALFPQFIRFESATPGVFTIVFITLAAVAIGCFLLYAYFGAKANHLFHRPRYRKSFNRASGAAFVGAGIAMAMSKE